MTLLTDDIDMADGFADAETETTVVDFWCTPQGCSETRYREWQPVLQAKGDYQMWLARQIVHYSLRIDRWQVVEELGQVRQARRAGSDCWDIDRRAEAEQLALGLARRPGLVSVKLKQTLQGCDWLIKVWRGLAAAQQGAEPGDPLTPLGEDDRQVALDLLGVDLGRRDGRTPLDPPVGTRETDDNDTDTDRRVATHQAALIAAQVDSLARLRQGTLVAHDAEDRNFTRRGFGPGVDASTREINRVVNTAARRIKANFNELRYLQGQSAASSSAATGSRLDAYLFHNQDQPRDRSDPVPAPPAARDADPAGTRAENKSSTQKIINISQPVPCSETTAAPAPPARPAVTATAASMGFTNPQAKAKLSDIVNPPQPMNRRARLAAAARQKRLGS